VSIRPAAPGDVPAIVRLANLAYRVEDFFVEGDRTDEPEVRGLVERGALLVLEEDGGLVGCVQVEATGRRGYLGLLSVDPARQGGGRGRRLVMAAEARLRAAGCDHVELTVVDVREELPPFYRRLGYTQVGTRPFPEPDKLKLPACFLRFEKPLG
jgi:ribosomal protein S18 acetylase RimI-like enzyme